MLQRIHSRLRRLAPRARLALAVLLTGAVAILDLTSGSDISFALLYLLPLGGLAWYNGEWAARLLTTVSSLGWLADGLIGAFHPVVAIWNTAIRTGFFLIVHPADRAPAPGLRAAADARGPRLADRPGQFPHAERGPGPAAYAEKAR